MICCVVSLTIFYLLFVFWLALRAHQSKAQLVKILSDTTQQNMLHWLPVQYRIIFKVLLLVYKGLNGLPPAYISELLHYCISSRSLRSSSQRLPSIPRTSLKTYGDRAFSAAGPRLWNGLPLSLRSSNTLTVFKKDLKTYLFKFAFS